MEPLFSGSRLYDGQRVALEKCGLLMEVTQSYHPDKFKRKSVLFPLRFSAVSATLCVKVYISVQSDTYHC